MRSERWDPSRLANHGHSGCTSVTAADADRDSYLWPHSENRGRQAVDAVMTAAVLAAGASSESSCSLSSVSVATGVYVDGFNLYYGSLRGTPYRWLDLEALARRLLPRDDIQIVRYFTARVSDRVDPTAPVRQDLYLRALRTLPCVQIHFGTFLTNNVWMPLAKPPQRGRRKCQVVKTEEKGSDVNLASHLLLDAFKQQCDTAVIISNDSDLAEPVTIARYELGMTVGVVNPHPARKRSRKLSQDAHFFKQLRSGALAGSQFPATLRDSSGTFRKPSGW